MNERSTAELLRICQDPASRDEAWRALLDRWGNAIRCASVRYQGGSCVAEFQLWFGAWLFLSPRRVERLRQVFGEAGSVGDEAPAHRFLRTVIATGVAEFGRERNGGRAGRRHETLEMETEARERDDRLCVAAGQAERVRAAAARIRSPNVRIPFWLRYYRLCGQLSPEDLARLQQSTPEATVLLRTGADAETANPKVNPFSYATIAKLLGAPVDPTGAYDVLTQRVRQGVLQVQQMLSASPEHTEPTEGAP